MKKELEWGNPPEMTCIEDLMHDSNSKSLAVIALDPGGTIGFSVMTLPFWPVTDMLKVITERDTWWHGELDTKQDEQKALHKVCRLLDTWYKAIVVSESFVLRQPQRGYDVWSPMRQNAIISYHLYLQNRALHLQPPSIKATANDSRLKIWGVYTSVGGLQHARDADRHLMIFLRKLMSAESKKANYIA